MKVLQFRPVLSMALVVLLLTSCGGSDRPDSAQSRHSSQEKETARVLYVDSYHPEYQWTGSIMDGLFGALGVSRTEDGEPLESTGAVTLKVIHMDTKRNVSEEFKFRAGEKARDVIESWKPDLVICSDDNAAKYLIVPHYLDSEIPFIFCGINHDASEYGFPTPNVTGILEIHNAPELVSYLDDYAQGGRIAYLAGDNLSSRKIGYSVQQQLGGELMQVYVESYREWKEQYARLQDRVDILLLETAQYLPDWDGNLRALEWFVMGNTRIPTGAWDDTLRTIALVTVERMGEEQGEWAGKTALRILKGESEISDIPVARGNRTALHLNMMLARNLEIVFPVDILSIAHLSNELDRGKKVLFVNSYHKGYDWSDDIEKGLVKALSRSDFPIDLQIKRMDTKNSPEPGYIEAKALELKMHITEWKPDIVIGSDDNFVKYLLAPYFRDGDIPFVFCGVNWDASEYGLPYSNATGILEVDPIMENIKILSSLSRGDRVGLLGIDTYYVRKIAKYSEEQTGVRFDLVLFVNDLEQWKAAYLRMQEEVDMLIVSSPVGLRNYNERDILDFIYKNAKIPSGITVDREIMYGLAGVSKIAEEQGWQAGGAALEILGGRPVSDIPISRNREIKTQLNLSLAKKMGFIFPPELLEED